MIDGGRCKGYGSSKVEDSHEANVLQFVTESPELATDLNLNSSPYVNADRQFYLRDVGSPKLRKKD